MGETSEVLAWGRCALPVVPPNEWTWTDDKVGAPKGCDTGRSREEKDRMWDMRYMLYDIHEGVEGIRNCPKDEMRFKGKMLDCRW